MANPALIAFGLCLLAASAFPQTVVSNVLNPSAGGAIVWFSAAQTNVAGLIDPAKKNPLSSSEGKFPQDFVFAFREGMDALLDRISIKPDARAGKTNWARRVSVAVSTNSPLDNFEDVGVLSLEQESIAQELPVGRRAQYLRLRVLENFGGRHLNLGEIKAYEGTEPDYVPIARRTVMAKATKSKAAEASRPDGFEPNDSVAQARKIDFGQPIRGSINPAGEFDYYSFTVPGSSGRVLTMDLAGEPNVRTAVALMRGNEVVKSFDPSKAVVQHAELSWMIPAGDYTLRLTEPPVSMVLIWDSSTSMRGSEQALQRGVEAFISHVKAPDRMQLIQFSSKPEVLTTNFSSEAAELLALFKKRYRLTSGTAFFDAVLAGVRLLDGVPGNRAIVVMTDGADTQSKGPYPEFWRILSEKRIRLYTIGLGKEMNRFVDKIGTSARRTLGHLADASNGRFFFTENAEQLLNLYEEISGELRSVSEYEFLLKQSRGDGALRVSATAGRRVVTNALAPMEIIFDASGSMREKIDQRRKIEVMKQVIPQIVDSLPPQQQIALRVYGHRIDSQRPGARTDSELVIPLGPVDKERLKTTIAALPTRGTTPIAHSLAQLPKDFANIAGEKTVVLVTDGREEAGGDPIKVVSDLLANGFKFKLNVVGFALGDRESKQQMQTIAEMTGGRFYDASSAAGLRDAVERSVVEDTLAVPFSLLDAADVEVARGITGDKAVSAPEGLFTLRVQTSPATSISNVRITTQQPTRVQLVKEGNEFTTRIDR